MGADLAKLFQVQMFKTPGYNYTVEFARDVDDRAGNCDVTSRSVISDVTCDHRDRLYTFDGSGSYYNYDAAKDREFQNPHRPGKQADFKTSFNVMPSNDTEIGYEVCDVIKNF